MYTMKETCDQVSLPYETLKYYCNEGLVPNVKRDANNYRIFDDGHVSWIKSLQCLKNCGLSIKEMKQYVNLAMIGKSTIIDRNQMLEDKKEILLKQLQTVKDSLDYIDEKQQFYKDVLSDKIEYTSYFD